MAMSLFLGFRKKRQLNRRDNQSWNKGFSLIEVLVAIAILAVVSIPIISAFSSAAQVNLNARRQENANAVAQKVMENVKAGDITDMVNKAGAGGIADPVTVSSVTNSSYGNYLTYVFDMGNYDATGNRYTSASKGDRFKVKVTLDPTAYSDRTDASPTIGNVNNNVNSYKMPSFSEAQSSGNVAILRQVYENDGSAISYFAGLGVDKDKISRNVSLYVDYTDMKEDGITLNSDGTYITYTQKVSMKVTYSAVGRTEKKEYSIDVSTSTIKGNLPGDEYKNIYLFYSPFDKYYTTATTKSNDKIDIYVTVSSNKNGDATKFNPTFDYTNTSMINKMLNIYLVEQDTVNVVDGKKIELKEGNVNLYLNGTDLALNAARETTTGTLKLGAGKNINILSNAACLKTSTTGIDNNSITTNLSGESDIKDLYNMTVEVWINEDDTTSSEAFLTLKSTKESADE